jgi:hypothetical protein
MKTCHERVLNKVLLEKEDRLISRLDLKDRPSLSFVLHTRERWTVVSEFKNKEISCQRKED